MVDHRYRKARLLLGSILTLMIFGSVFHLHSTAHPEAESDCIICHFLGCWSLVEPTIFVFFFCRLSTALTRCRFIDSPQRIAYVQPPLRAPPHFPLFELKV